MNPQGDSMGVFLFLGMVVFFGTSSHCQTCEVNFHLESTSVMLLPGDNASVLCDATCFGHDSGVDVTWRNVFGKQVGSNSRRVFSVRYNRGLMNRILLINASQDTVGTYICTVTRNGEVLNHKPIEFIILGSNGNVINVPREDTGPRRGDITADRDLDYRPVRSVDRARSRMDKRHPTVDHPLKQRDHQYRELHEKNWIETSGEESYNVNKNSNEITMFEKINTIYERNKQLQNVNNKVQKMRNLGLYTKHTDLVQSRSVSQEKRVNGLYGIMDLKLRTRDGLISAQQIKAENLGPSTTKIYNGDQSYNGYLRVRRQIETTTEDPNNTPGRTDTTTKDAVQDNTASGQPQVHTNGTTSNDSSHVTSEPEQTSTDPTILPTSTPEKATGKAEENTDDGLYDDVTSPPCTASPSSFGKYGVLAFSITLAVAFLLLYAILMIIFMPKIMARRKEKSNIEVGAYRRTGPDTSDTAPLAVLDGSDIADCDITKHDVTGFDNPAFQSEETADITKEEATTETTASVSTFLLRQDSGRQTEEANKEKETKDETNANDKEDSSPQPDKTPTAEPIQTEQPPASAMDEIRPESSIPQESSDLLNDFRFSDFMMSTSGGQSEGTSLADERADAGKHSMEGIFGNVTAGSGATGVDLLPPPPSDQNNV